MTEEDAAAFQREGEITVAESTDEDTSADSQSEKDNQEGESDSQQRDKNTADDKDLPFHEHPRWKEREDEWTRRFNDQETRHADELKQALEGIRKEFGQARDANAKQTQIPAWFGGTQEQWDAYRADRDAELKAAGDAAVKEARESLKNEQGAEAKAVEEATAYLRSEMAAIEGDKTLNPSGKKIDRETADKLLKTVIDNELIDTKGRWNYRAGWRLMNAGSAEAKPAPKVDTKEKKEVAAASTSESRGGSEKDKPAIATSDTFKKNRPW